VDDTEYSGDNDYIQLSLPEHNSCVPTPIMCGLESSDSYSDGVRWWW